MFHTNRNKLLKTVEKQQLTKTLYLEILFCHASNMEPQVKKSFSTGYNQNIGVGLGGVGWIYTTQLLYQSMPKRNHKSTENK